MANSLLQWPSTTSVVYPYMTLDGVYPMDFSFPRPMSDFLRMPESTLERLSRAYELEIPASSNFTYATRASFHRQGGYGSTLFDRRAVLMALLEYLGACQVVESLRYTEQSRFDAFGYGYGSYPSLLGR